MADRYFQPHEVERLIPELTRIMGAIMRAQREGAEARARLQAEKQRITLAGGGVVDQRAWRADAERLGRAGDRVQRGVERIVELGGVPKDLSLGLVDFPHLRGRAEVNLCWKYGEERVGYWHGLDEGYAGRKPL